ncbi:MAG TPA: hypothetical protein VKA49_18730 [Flavitalea sp.]|nr:hypothetical protein [Flavitalea sp.]
MLSLQWMLNHVAENSIAFDILNGVDANNERSTAGMIHRKCHLLRKGV